MRDLQDGSASPVSTTILRSCGSWRATSGSSIFGQLVEVGETGALFARPRHPYTRMLVDSRA